MGVGNNYEVLMMKKQNQVHYVLVSIWVLLCLVGLHLAWRSETQGVVLVLISVNLYATGYVSMQVFRIRNRIDIMVERLEVLREDEE